MNKRISAALSVFLAVFLTGTLAYSGQDVYLQVCPEGNKECVRKVTLSHAQQIYDLHGTCKFSSGVGNFNPASYNCESGNDTRIICKQNGTDGAYAVCSCGWAKDKLNPNKHQQVSMHMCCDWNAGTC
ncbi:hypothetical protein [Bauldia sp.]|uniref:hypothetical protein n=1 Tax=Bauldia sp. TaxID=2575872 RepID=UPI003BAA00B1